MKQKLLFLCFGLFLSIQIYSQETQSTPPPCGIDASYVCDEDEDGAVVVNLYELFPFSFCYTDPAISIYYYPMIYYLTEEDYDLDINPIPNADVFATTVTQESIWMRAKPIDPDAYTVREKASELEIMIPPTPYAPSPLYACSNNNDGYGIFNLNDKRNEIRSNQSFNYILKLFETYADAESLTNPIAYEDFENYVNVIPYQQTIYASMYVEGNWSNNISSCIRIVSFDLIVGDCEDVAIGLLSPSANPRPGFNYTNQLHIRNSGSSSSTGSIEFIHDANLVFVNAVSSNPNYTFTPTTNGFIVDYVALEPGDLDHITITLNCPPTVTLGTLITNTASLINNTDTFPNNDSATLSEIVVGSYDPNDKMELHGPTLIIDNFTSEDYLYYTIRFQNVGTAEAINIKIEDLLNAQLDESTFQMIRASHNYSVSRVGKSLKWSFNNILLPSEDTNEEASHGFVHFKVKPNAGYAIGDIIPNTAAIYFDANPAVVTNIFNTEFVQTLSVSDYDTTSFSIHPNPANDIVNIRMNGSLLGTFNVEVFDVQGKHVLSHTSADESTMQLNVSSLESGLYFIKIKMGLNETIKKLIVN